MNKRSGFRTSEGGAGPAWNGWIAEGHTWTYSSTDTHTYVVTVNADVTGYINIGTPIKMTNQSATQYFFVSLTPTVSNGVTTITMYGGTVSSLTNTPITNVSYGLVGTRPIGFSQKSADYTEAFTDTGTNRTVVTPTINVWTNTVTAGGNFGQLVVPIGIWWLGLSANLWGASQSINDAQTSAYCSLSTSPTSESDSRFTSQIYVESNENAAREWTSGINTPMKVYEVVVTTKTTFYVIVKTDVTLVTNQTIGLAAANVATRATATIKWAT